METCSWAVTFRGARGRQAASARPSLSGPSAIGAKPSCSARAARIVSCGIGLDGLGPGTRGRLGGPRQCLRIDILPDVRHFAISNGNGEDPIVLERPICGYDSPLSKADDQNPVALRYEFRGLWE